MPSPISLERRLTAMFSQINGLSVRRGEAIVLGNDEEYTVDKLIKIANELSRLYDQFFAYLDGEGLSHSMSKKMDFTQAEASLSPGKPSAK
jgi:hypothetical protein